MAVKLDISKAYDRVEYDFLMAMMRKMQLPKYFVNLILWCIQSMEFRIPLNRHPPQAFGPTQNIRQGYPISFSIPYMW